MSSTSPTSLRGKLVVCALALVIVIQLFAVVVSGRAAETSSIAVAEDAIQRDGQTTVQSILRHLEPAEQSVEVTARLLAGDVLDLSAPGLEQYLYTQLAVMDQVNGAFVGFPDGSFVFVNKEGEGFRTKRITAVGGRDVVVEYLDANFETTSTERPTDDTYDPVVRPWYELASASDGTIWTDPYVFFSSQQPGVTASRAVRVSGELVAVVGVDVELSGLAQFLDQMASTENGEAFVVSDDVVVGAPSLYASNVVVDADGTVQLPTTAALGIAGATDVELSSVERIDGVSGDDLVFRRQFGDGALGWDVVIRAPASEFTTVVESQRRMTLLITVGGGLIVLVGLLILWQVSRPIKRLAEQAATDPLTGASNRRTIETRGAQSLRLLDDGECLAVIALDLDGFKAVNDKWGHQRGDQVLVAVTEAARSVVRETDLVGRLGGDEFVVTQVANGRADADVCAQRVLSAIRARLADDFSQLLIGVTAGVAVGMRGSDTIAGLLQEADEALIAAKTDARGRDAASTGATLS